MVLVQTVKEHATVRMPSCLLAMNILVKGESTEKKRKWRRNEHDWAPKQSGGFCLVRGERRGRGRWTGWGGESGRRASMRRCQIRSGRLQQSLLGHLCVTRRSPPCTDHQTGQHVLLHLIPASICLGFLRLHPRKNAGSGIVVMQFTFEVDVVASCCCKS